MIAAIVVNTVGVGLCLYAYSRDWEWQPSPLLVLRGATILLGIALSCTLAALLLEVPEARGVFVVVAFVAIGVVIWRRKKARRIGPLTSEAAAPDASAMPRRTQAPRPARNEAARWSSVTIRDIENMEVQP